MGKVCRLVKHRSVIDRLDGKDISQEPEMIELKGLYGDMTPAEKERTEKFFRNIKGNGKKSQKTTTEGGGH